MGYLLIFVVLMAASFIVQRTLTSRIEKYSKTPLSSGLSGKEVAENYYAKIEYQDFGTYYNDYMVEHLAKSHINPWGGTLASTGDIWANMVQAVTLDGMTPADAMAKYSQQCMDEFASYGFATAMKAN